MLYNKHIHPKAMLVKSFLGHIQRFLGDLQYPIDELIVVNYHGTPQKFIQNFELQVLFFKKNFDIINPFELEDYFSGKLKTKRCKLLFTFDDGLKNNLYAAKTLASFGIKAFYFLVPEFIETKTGEQKQYYIKNIRPVINAAIDSEPEDFEAMNWNDVSELLKEGNRIGSHTYTHTLIAETSDSSNSEKEIVESQQYLETNTTKQINSFCSINNTLHSVGKKEKELIEKNYAFHFTTLPGYNFIQKNPLYIKRRNIESYWLQGAVYFAIGKTDLKRWLARVKQYSEL
jgi:peptidoglycan/xylan/chitin deacetylase (PgdA/CDA1 family)